MLRLIKMDKKITVSSFYQFANWDEQVMSDVSSALDAIAQQQSLRGLVLIAPEGINATICGSAQGMLALKELVATFPGCNNVSYKDNFCDKFPFRRFKIDRRKELITYDEALVPTEADQRTHLSPAEWDRVLSEEQDYLLIDTRNWYEVELGKFKGAIDPKIKNFTDLREFVERQNLPRDKKVLMYCTGGVRCEKAAIDFERMGFKQVFQLDGGILRYLEQFPNRHFEGECFVFDHRVSVDQDLAPSKIYSFCPHCGQPGTLRISCSECQKPCVVCADCESKPGLHSCSKNCAYHIRRKAGVGENHGPQ